MRNRIERLVQIVLALVFFWGVCYLIWSAVHGHLAWRTLTAYSIGSLAFGTLLLFCWPPRKKRKSLFYFLLAVGWASLGVARLLQRRDSIGATLAGLLVMINLLISWSEYGAGKKSPSSSAPSDEETTEAAP
jgi:hypothetical protein